MAGLFDDLIPQSPGGAALTPADHAAFALQQRAMALQAAQMPAETVQQQGAAVAPTAGATPNPFEDLVPKPVAAAAPARPSGPITFDDLASKSPAAVPASRGPITFDDLAPQQPVAATATVDPPWAKYVQPAQPPAPQQAPDDDPMTRAPATWADTSRAVGGAGRYTDDIVRLIANGATFGLADKAAGATISSPQAEAARTAAAAQDTGTAGKIAGFAGALAPAIAGGGAVAAGARAVESVPTLGRLFANPVVQGSVTGAGMGTADAVAHGEPAETGAALGAVGGAGGAALGSAVGAGARGIGSLFADAPPVMTSPQLRAAASQAYTDADNAGLVYSPEAVARLRGAVQDHMAQFGYAPELQPGGAAVLRSLDRSDGTPTTLAGLDITRRIAGNMYSPTNPSSSALGGGIKGVIDDFTANPRPGDVLMGDQAAGVDALTNARQLYQRSSKDQDLSDALQSAELRAGSTGSGGNVNNATRQNVRGVLESRNDWTPDERAALTSIVMGSPVSNTLRQIGKASPEGNGLVPLLELGGMHLAPGAIAVPAVGFAAKRMSDAATARAVADAGNLIRSGGDAAALRAPPNMMQQFGASAPAPISSLSLGALYAPQPGQLQVYDGLPGGR